MKNNKSQKNITSNWKQLKLVDIFEFKNGLNKEKKYFGKGTPIINYVDVYKGGGLFQKTIKGLVEVSKSEKERFNVKKGDVFFTRTSETLNEIGFSAVALGDFKDTVFSGFILRARPKNNLLLPDYAKYCFKTQKARQEIKEKSSYTTRALTSGSLLNHVNISLPSAFEQNRIVLVLETWDKTIEKLSEKIKIKKQIKKGLMQDLLTGKKRLKGFSDNWEETKMKYFLEETDERVSDRIIEPVAVGVFGIRKRTEIFYKELSNDYSNNKVLRQNELCFGIGTKEIVSDVLLSNNIYCVSPAYKIFKIKQHNPYFIDKYIDIYRKKISSIFMIISARQGKSVDFDGLFNFKIKIPNIKEQNAISEILKTSDKEIDKLERKLKTIKDQKKYLLNNLITGTIRTPETLSTKVIK